jgi:hypothetical protein
MGSGGLMSFFVGEVGKPISISCGFDVTGLFAKQVTLVRPDSTEITLAAAEVTVDDASIGQIHITSRLGDLSLSGTYMAQAKITFSGGNVRFSPMISFEVEGVIEGDYTGPSTGTYEVGDLLIADSTTTLSRLPIGEVGESLTVGVTGFPEWAGDQISFNVKMYGAEGNGIADDTAAITAAFVAAAAGGRILFPTGIYLIDPVSFFTAYSATNYYVGLLKDNMVIEGQGDVTIKLIDHWSTVGTPKEMICFGTNAEVSNVTVRGITFDFNAAEQSVNNQVWHHAAIGAWGASGKINNLVIEDNTFQNILGSNVILTGGNDGIGKKALIRANQFIDNGSGTTDHSTIYSMSEDTLIEGNRFYNSSMPTVTRNAFELHAARSKAINNSAYNFTQLGIIVENTIESNYASEISGNTAYIDGWGIWIWTGLGITGGHGISDFVISNNEIRFNDSVISGGAGYKLGINLQMDKGISGGRIFDNKFIGTESVTEKTWGIRASCITTAEKVDNIQIYDNSFYNIDYGIYATSIGTGVLGTVGNLQISDNAFTNLGPVTSGNAIYTNFATARPISQLTITNNFLIEDRVSPVWAVGINLTGNHSKLIIQRNAFVGLISINTYTGAASDTSVFSVGAYGDAVGNFTPAGVKIGGSLAAPTSTLDIIGTSSSDQLRITNNESYPYIIGRSDSTGFLDFAGSQAGYIGYSFDGALQVASVVTGSGGGYYRTFAEASGTPSGTTTTFDISVDVPAGAKLLGAQLRVDTALTAGETWGAAYVTGSSTVLAAPGQAVAQNTKVNKMHVDEITTATTKVRITRDSGNFTNAVGVIRAIVCYETFTAMGSL